MTAPSHLFAENPNLMVWVLAPHIITEDPNLNYYYDFSQSVLEYTKVFESLAITWKWQLVTLDDLEIVINKIVEESAAENMVPLVLNLCDGDEINGAPGLSVIRLLKEKKLLFTGADEYFYTVTTSKIVMKRCFDEAQVATPKWHPILHASEIPANIFTNLGTPFIVKPSVSGGSMGVGIKNVVYTETQFAAQVQEMFKGYRGWKLDTDGLVAESFVNGPEFTVLIVGNYDSPGEAIIYPPVERVFHDSLPEYEKFLSFDRLWEIYEEETPMPKEDNFYEYASPAVALHEGIKAIAWQSFAAVKGTGYARIDIRMDKESGKLYVLEVNAQCGISEDEDFTSIGAILRLSGVSFATLVMQIIDNAFTR